LLSCVSIFTILKKTSDKCDIGGSVYYTGVSGSTELIAGEGLTNRTVVRIGGVPVRLRFLSAGFALATIPQGAVGTAVTVGT
jgi:hypothetical protein